MTYDSSDQIQVCARCRTCFTPTSSDALCPNCMKVETQDVHRTPSEKRRRMMNAPSAIIVLAVAAVVVSVACFALGLGLQAAIPGCHCDEGAGCSFCAGFGNLISFLIFGGFIGALVSVLYVLPGSLLLATILRFFSNWRRRRHLRESV